MKRMTCAQLGGPCDLAHEEETADEVIKKQHEHPGARSSERSQSPTIAPDARMSVHRVRLSSTAQSQRCRWGMLVGGFRRFLQACVGSGGTGGFISR